MTNIKRYYHIVAISATTVILEDTISGIRTVPLSVSVLPQYDCVVPIFNMECFE